MFILLKIQIFRRYPKEAIVIILKKPQYKIIFMCKKVAY